jgi:dihydropyrimidine dehydrogenase (NAD+) subunit PreT
MTEPRFPVLDGRLEQGFADKKPAYTPAEAVAESNRCIYCVDAPCITACPTGIDIPTFIHKISTGNVAGAARTIFEQNLLGTTCSRVCPVEVLCVGDCVYNQWGREPIEIGRLQRYATETALAKDPALLAKTTKPKTGKKIACIGAGPASLAAAAHLALEGHSVTLYEQRVLPGGLNTLGIAPYKLKAEDSLAELEHLLSLGDIELKTGVAVVADDAVEGEVTAASLLEQHDAVFLGVGLGADTLLNLPGAEGPDVHGAVYLIERIKSDPSLSLAGVRRALVIGGGNTAIDIAHELALLGVSDVAMVYRRGRDAMSAYAHELDYGTLHGVRVVERAAPVAFLRDEAGKLTGLRVAETDDGRPRNGTERDLPCDLIALAIGQARLTQLAKAFAGVSLDDKGRVQVDERTCRTAHPRVYAGGDCVNGGKEVVNAAQHGKLAARAIHQSFGAKT